MRREHKSETGKLRHVRRNEFTYGETVVTKYLGGYCVAKLGNAMSWEADSEAELVERIDAAGFGEGTATNMRKGETMESKITRVVLESGERLEFRGEDARGIHTDAGIHDRSEVVGYRVWCKSEQRWMGVPVSSR